MLAKTVQLKLPASWLFDGAALAEILGGGGAGGAGAPPFSNWEGMAPNFEKKAIIYVGG